MACFYRRGSGADLCSASLIDRYRFFKQTNTEILLAAGAEIDGEPDVLVERPLLSSA
jgi:hypothetical protein